MHGCGCGHGCDRAHGEVLPSRTVSGGRGGCHVPSWSPWLSHRWRFASQCCGTVVWVSAGAAPVSASAEGGRVLGRVCRPTGTSPRHRARHPTLPPPPRGVGAAAVLPAAGCLHRLPAQGGCPSPTPMSGGAEGAAPLPQLNAVSTCHRGGDSWESRCPHHHSTCHAHHQGGWVTLWPAVPGHRRWSVPAMVESTLDDANTITYECDRGVTAGVGHHWLWGTLSTTGHG